MEIFQARDHYILQSGTDTLWCSRLNGHLSPKPASELCNAWNPICLGTAHGFIGKLQIHPECDARLLLIRDQLKVGELPDGSPVYRITKLVTIPLASDELQGVELDRCKQHHFGINKSAHVSSESKSKSWNPMKSSSKSKGELKDIDKYERRVLEEIYRLFDNGWFYYSTTADLTRTRQDSYRVKKFKADPSEAAEGEYFSFLPNFAGDERFLWNFHILRDLLRNEDPEAGKWIVPVIQGHFQQAVCNIRYAVDGNISSTGDNLQEITLTLISRRSRHRAGARYKRRGIDASGACANYVETEQILQLMSHIVSFVQVRGSIPLYWSQSGAKYRPPPRIDKDFETCHEPFCLHITDQAERYNHVYICNLVDQTGSESLLGKTFLDHVVQLDSPAVTYVSFDFHERCKGLKYESIGQLIEHIQPLLKHMRYCWGDMRGAMCEQRGVFRVNCVDCLDRTNVVQTAISRVVMETQCRKLGLFAPDEDLPLDWRLCYQQLWAANGDAISRQYSGTAALKGDFTRTGDRKLSGVMADGVKSVNRYYLSRFKDEYRQLAIDTLLGTQTPDQLEYLSSRLSGDVISGLFPQLSGSSSTADAAVDEHELMEQEENMRQLIEESRGLIIAHPEEFMGGWPLISLDSSSSSSDEMNRIILLSKTAIYNVIYDDEEENLTYFQRISLEDIDRIELGPEPGLLRAARGSRRACLRLHFRFGGESGYFHTFRTTQGRLFNNSLILIRTQDEAMEALRAVSEAIQLTVKMMDQDIVAIDGKIERKKSRRLPMKVFMPVDTLCQTDRLAHMSLTRNTQAPGAKASPRLKHKSSPTTAVKHPSSPGRSRGGYMQQLKRSIARSLAPSNKSKSAPTAVAHFRTTQSNEDDSRSSSPIAFLNSATDGDQPSSATYHGNSQPNPTLAENTEVKAEVADLIQLSAEEDDDDGDKGTSTGDEAGIIIEATPQHITSQDSTVLLQCNSDSAAATEENCKRIEISAIDLIESEPTSSETNSMPILVTLPTPEDEPSTKVDEVNPALLGSSSSSLASDCENTGLKTSRSEGTLSDKVLVSDDSKAPVQSKSSSTLAVFSKLGRTVKNMAATKIVSQRKPVTGGSSSRVKADKITPNTSNTVIMLL